MNHELRNKVLLSLAALQLAVILGSWLYSAALPDSSVRAILSDSGIRWFFGTFAANLSNPILVYVILLDISAGACLYSGLWAALAGAFRSGGETRHPMPSTPQIHSGLWAALICAIAEAAVVLLLTAPRHAILLSATGSLFPSSFSESLIPIIAFMLLSASISYGLFSGTLHNYRDAIHCCIRGGSNLKFVLAFYILAMQLWKMIEYSFISTQ